jgi:hypothetical protein
MTLLTAAAIAIALFTQAPATDDAAFAAGSSARLTYMKRSVVDYDIRATDSPKPFKLLTEPVLRFTNPVGKSRDGTVFLWLGDGGRPAAVVQASLNRRRYWVHEFSSLSSTPINAKGRAGVVWHPESGGVTFRPVPGAPSPADTAEKRLAQMREMCRDFLVEDKFQDSSWQTLRLLSKPFARYGEPNTSVEDGALFCYVLTTDPEAYLMLEVQTGKERPAWYYSFAPSTTYPLRASIKGEQVWTLHLDGPVMGISKGLHQFRYSDDRVEAER